tara:strand:+ start:62 stop:715 length:654 start_codon:yes stop_codon:yes gene_type:complete
MKESKKHGGAQEKVDIPYIYYHWGPFLYQAKIAPHESQMLIKEGKKCRNKSNDYRTHLAGHLSEEYILADIKGITEWFKKYLVTYIDAYKQWRGRGYTPRTNLLVDVVWINYMKSNEFNPPHNHDGDLSFVIYPDIPQEIIKEYKNYKGTTTGPGGIGWFYGEAQGQYIDNVSLMPQTGDLFIFPASLKHWVFPFRSKVERISVSGNISFGKEGKNV